jgi:hypothetical protein
MSDSRNIPIRILEKENNKRGDLFNRLMKDLFLTLGYDNPRFNIHKSGREIDIQAEHRTENKLAVAECKATEKTIGGDDVNKFAGALDAERRKKRKKPRVQIEGYYISLSGFKETAVEQEKEAGDRLVLMDGKRVMEELIRGRIIVTPEKAAEQAGRCAAGISAKLEHGDCFELLAHDMGWIWLVCFHTNKKKTHFALVHADGDALAPEKAQVIIDADKSVEGELHRLEYLPPPQSPAAVEDCVTEAHEKYLGYLESQCGDITLEGLPADQEVGSRRLNLENLFVPLHLVSLDAREREPVLLDEEDQYLEVLELDEEERQNRQPVGQVIGQCSRLAILAAPGGGKTTLIKRLAVAYAFPDRRSLLDDDLPDRPWLPLFIRCRQLGERVSASVSENLYDIAFRAEIGPLKDAFSMLVNRSLKDGHVLLLVDGLDEISDESNRVAFVIQLRTFLATYPNVNVLVTSREAGFRIVGGALSAHCAHYKIADFNGEDIKRLTLAWHKEVLGDRPEVLEEAEKLTNIIRDSDRVMQLAKNPLLLTTLLLVKRWVGQLPTRRTVLYGKAIEVLLMTWNVEGFEPMEQDEAIPQLAFVAFTMMKEGIQRISSKRLKEVLNMARKQMPEVLGYAQYSVAEFIERVEYRSSLLMLSGHEIEDGTLYPMYEFRHLTFQEYLTALAIVEGYYPDREEEDTLLSILELHLWEEKWKEVIPLAAVLAGRKVQPLVQRLIELCKAENVTHKEPSPNYIVNHLLGQCILDEIQLAPKLLECALEWIGRKSPPPSSIIRSLIQSRYGDLLEKVVRKAYKNSDTDLRIMGATLGEIHLQKFGWKDNVIPSPQTCNNIEALLEDESEIQKTIGAFCITLLAYYFSYGKGSDRLRDPNVKKILRPLANKLIVLIYSEIPYLQFATLFALTWLEGFKIKYTPYVLMRLLELWKSSTLPIVKDVVCEVILTLPIFNRKLKPLPEPNSDDLNFIKEQFLKKGHPRQAALIFGFYWCKPWRDDKLINIAKGLGDSGIEGTLKSRLLRALGREINAEKKAMGDK